MTPSEKRAALRANAERNNLAARAKANESKYYENHPWLRTYVCEICERPYRRDLSNTRGTIARITLGNCDECTLAFTHLFTGLGFTEDSFWTYFGRPLQSETLKPSYRDPQNPNTLRFLVDFVFDAENPR